MQTRERRTNQEIKVDEVKILYAIRELHNRDKNITIQEVSRITDIEVKKLYNSPSLKRELDKTNHYFQTIRDLGYGIEVTTTQNSQGTMHLVKDGVRVHFTQFKTGGDTATIVMKGLANSKITTDRSNAMRELLTWIKKNR
jgi:hypothetical protein